ncbi:hypothetical protein [Chamaesiphon polymorphus]|uniref:Uncharacterized protein n=1 Tax=Chamaesiphon polymorphus CCALA 037 TaxID=2107692 RepID=A0A2T1GEU0_9CYAN|nr:hypothetical protein [Chamaesiphon polymorphus]PSB56101.1 hypothetical protein C7B77_12935 [Chamaesiphon polymorphus CCALA 037]
MDALTEKLDIKLLQWKPEVADRVRQSILEIIELADRDVLDILPSRAVEQDVLESIDEPTTR